MISVVALFSLCCKYSPSLHLAVTTFTNSHNLNHAVCCYLG